MDEVAAAYLADAPMKELAARYGMSAAGMVKRLRQHGTTIRKQGASQWRRQPEPFDEALLRSLHAQQMSTREIAAEMGGSEELARDRMIRLGLSRLAGKARQDRNYFWKGGRTIDKHGYVLVKANDHPYRTAAGYVREHRLVMEQMIGRYLLPTEVVDHIDGSTANNDPSNLRLFERNAEHLRVTRGGRCPNWTADGQLRLQSSTQRKVDRADATIDRLLESGAPLSRSQIDRLRASLRTDRLSPSRKALWLAWAEAHPRWAGTVRESADL